MTQRLVFLLIVLAFPRAILAQSTGDTPAEVSRHAEDAFQRGLELSDTQPARAPAEFDLAAAHYERLIDEFGVESAGAHLNLGNARLLSGRTGLAVLAYRRAQRIDPTAEDIEAALRHARSRVGVTLKPDASTAIVAGLRRTLSLVGRPVLLGAGALLWITAWSLAGARLARPRLPRQLPLVAGLSAVFLLALPVAERVIDARTTEGVLISDDVVARAGPGAGVYDESFTEPLPAGLEVQILREHGRWTRVRLADGKETWVPSHAVERI
jgi:hypothetical protein